jgi:hypothetical protein
MRLKCGDSAASAGGRDELFIPLLVTDWWRLPPQMVGVSTLFMMARLVAAVATLRGVLC